MGVWDLDIDRQGRPAGTASEKVSRAGQHPQVGRERARGSCMHTRVFNG